MIHVENDYEPFINEQPIHSHIFENHEHFLLNYYTRPINNKKTIEKIVDEITVKKTVETSSTNHIYQNVPKEPLRFKKFNMDILIVSGPESNIIKVPFEMK